MMKELKSSLQNEKEVDTMLKKLLEKYSLTMEDITAKGIDLNEISEDEIEAKIIEAFEIEVEGEAQNVDAGDNVEENAPEGEETTESNEEPVNEEGQKEEVDVVDGQGEEEQPEGESVEEAVEPEVVEQPEVQEQVEEQSESVEEAVDVDALQVEIQELKAQLETANTELESLREFKLNVEKADHEAKADKLFSDFQLSKEDVEGLDVHKFSIEEIEEKCYAILGRKMAQKKNFSLNKEKGNIRIDIQNEDTEEKSLPYGGLIEKYKNK